MRRGTLWTASLPESSNGYVRCLSKKRVAENTELFLEGLLGDEQRKTSWMRAGGGRRSRPVAAAGDPGSAGIFGTLMLCAISYADYVIGAFGR